MSQYDLSDTELTTANRRLLVDMYAAAKAGDVAGFFSALSPEVVIKEPTFLPYGGTYRGIDEFRALFGDVAKFLDMSSLTVDRIVADGDHAFGLIRLSTTSGDREVRLAELSILREGKVAEMEIFVHDGAGLLGAARPSRS
jgi:ketosteroid isomerase-like protein